MEALKVCTKCKVAQPISQFYTRAEGRKHSWCRACVSVYSKEYWRTHTRKEGPKEPCLTCGKPIVAKSRSSYCQKCYPFRNHCKKCGRIISPSGEHKCPSDELKTCKVCGVVTNLARRRVCNQCKADETNARARERRKRIKAVFGSACSICGYDRCQWALHLHHVDSSEKALWSGKHRRTNPKEIELYPERFALVCANCHAELHEAEE